MTEPTAPNRPVHGHQVVVDWMGTEVPTLADLWPDQPRAVIVGVNPAPASVEAGHYYQGANGRTAMSRLQAAGLLPPVDGGHVDDAAVAAGIGFTDVVKRPTGRATDLTVAELAHGRDLLRAALRERAVPLVVCVFRPAVAALLGRAGPPGFQESRFDSTVPVFRMPGPYDRKDRVAAAMAELTAHVAGP